MRAIDWMAKHCPSRQAISVAGGREVLTDCSSPDCVGKAPKMYINNESGAYQCKRCGKQGALPLPGRPSKPPQISTEISKLRFGPDAGHHVALDSTQTIKVAPEDVLAYKSLLKSPAGAKALAYLKGRGISDEAIEEFSLGYNKERNAIAIPNLDRNGRAVVGLAYRSLNPDAATRYTQESLGGEKQLPYGLWRMRGKGMLFICEGQLDAISAWQLNPAMDVLAFNGINNLPLSRKDDRTGVLTMIDEYKEVVLAPDNDLRSWLTMLKFSETIGRKRTTLLRLPNGAKDVNDALKAGASSADFSNWLSMSRGQAEIAQFEVATNLHEQALAAMQQQSSRAVVSTGFAGLDEALGGLRPGELTVLAGSAGTGKTTLATQIVWQALKAGYPSIIGSFEMPAVEAIYPRLLCLEDKVNYFARGGVAKATRPSWADRLSFLCPNAAEVTIGQASAYLDAVYRARKLSDARLVLVLIDNLSEFKLYSSGAFKSSDRFEQEAEQIAEIKAWTKRYNNMHVILLAHLNKAVEGGLTKNRIRGNSMIANKPDCILLMDALPDGGSKLIVDKARNLGSKRGAVVKLAYDYHTTMITEASLEDAVDESF